MNQETTITTVADLLAFPFRSPGWAMKLVIATALVVFSAFLFFIPLIFYYGYLARMMRAIAGGGAEPQLPEWNEWGDLFIDGLRFFAAGLVYSLPLMLLFAVGYASYFVPVLIGVITESEELMGLLSLVGMGTGWFLFGLGTVLGTLLMFILPAALAHTASKQSLAAAFHIRSWWSIFRANLGSFLVAGLMFFGLLAVVYVVYMGFIFTIILCWLAPFLLLLLMIYASLVHLALAAHAYRGGTLRLAEQQLRLESIEDPAL